MKITRTEIKKVMEMVKSGKYNLAREMAIARQRFQLKLKGTMYEGEVLDDFIIAIALECVINRI